MRVSHPRIYTSVRDTVASWYRASPTGPLSYADSAPAAKILESEILSHDITATLPLERGP